jgi:DNA invertase Pin-like site-specific DNA recombinase
VNTDREAAVAGRQPWRKAARRSIRRLLAAPVGAPDPNPSPLPAVPEPTGRRRALGYVLRDREAAQAQLAPQIDEIHAWCAASGLALQDVVHDVAAPGEQRARPSLQWALAQIAEREADTLVVSRLGDLSGSAVTLSPLLRWFMDESRALVAIDLGLDTSTPEGHLAAEAVAGVGSLERERISVRTREGMAAARSRGGVQGRIAVADMPELHERIGGMREDGMTLQAIADVLNEDGVPTLRGGMMWRPSSVQRATGYRRPPSASGLPLPRTTSGFGRRRDA